MDNEGIILTNINLTGISIKEQNYKISEEEQEFIDAVNDYMFNEPSKEIRNHVIEEFWDTVQVKLGLLDKIGISASEVIEEYDKHLEKLKSRPRKRE